MKDAIGFWENKGQVKTTAEQPATEVKYYTQGAYPRAYFQSKTRISFVLASRDTTVTVPDTLYRLDMRCVGNNARDVDPQAYLVKTYHQNFYLPWTGTGVEQVQGYSRLVYPEIYPNIDLHFYSGPRGQKMAFVCHPGSDPADIRLQFTGNDDIDVDWQGNLRLLFGNKWVPFREAVAFQYDQNMNITNLGWNASYAIDSVLSISNFTFSSYDPTMPLVLQIGPSPAGGGGPIETPGLCWSTYFGGDQRDIITSSTQDEQGNYFVAGRTGSGQFEFPAAPGTQIYGNTGGDFGFLVKMNDIDQMSWWIYLGGEGIDFTIPTAVVTKSANGLLARVYLAGHTNSFSLNTFNNPDLPNEYFQGTSPGFVWKGFLAYFENDALGFRKWTTYFGAAETFINGMAKDADERLFITGRVSGDLPSEQDVPPPGAEDYGYSGGQDAYIALFNSGDRLNWRTHYGGSGDDRAAEVVVGPNKVVIAGDTDSPDMITVHGGSNALNEPFSGEIRDAFVAEFGLDGVQHWGTCFAADQSPSFSSIDLFGKGLALDPITQDIVIGGTVFFDGLPIVPGPGWYDDTPTLGVINGFLARFSGADRSLAWSTYVAGTDMNDIRTLYFDDLGNLYVAGRTRDLSFPLRDLSGMFFSNSIQTDIFQGLVPEESDLFIMSFTPDHWLAWATYFGGEAGTTHEGLFTLLRRNGDIYAAGYTTKSIIHWVGPYFESYFPLHDPQVPGVHFEEYYGDVPDFQGNPTADAFITRFCASPLTNIPEREPSAQPMLHAWQQGSHIAVAGLPTGTHRVLVTDAAGRVVGSLRATSDGQLGTLRSLPWAEGTYILVFPDLGKQSRLFITR
ncbi:MAG: hypothetical protein ACK4L7_00590 [Flavobacteriales bacterium]